MDDRAHRAVRLEAVLWIVTGALAFLARGNPRLVLPDALHFFAALLAAGLTTSLAARFYPEARALHALSVIASLTSIAGIVDRSGGVESNLWVLYLLPLFTATILLDRRETAWIAAGACAANAAAYLVVEEPWRPAWTFELCLKTGILGSAAWATALLSAAERAARERVARQRAELAGLEEALKVESEARERERGVAAIAGLSAAAIHDLGTPLMVIRGYSRVHLDGGGLPPLLERDLRRVDAAAAFCQELVAGLLARGRSEATECGAAVLVQSAACLAEPILAQKGVRLVVEEIPEGLAALAPRRDAERILLNLAGNAAKALPRGGTVAVSARAVRDDAGAWVEVVVADDGPGIPPEVEGRLFQAFVTGDAGRGGTGLGLHLSREAARRFGGDLRSEKAERGARFVLRLPAAVRELAA